MGGRGASTRALLSKNAALSRARSSEEESEPLGPDVLRCRLGSAFGLLMGAGGLATYVLRPTFELSRIGYNRLSFMTATVNRRTDHRI